MAPLDAARRGAAVLAFLAVVGAAPAEGRDADGVVEGPADGAATSLKPPLGAADGAAAAAGGGGGGMLEAAAICC